MFGERGFLEDSSSDFEADQPETPPPYYQQGKELKPSFEKEFEIDDKPLGYADYYTNPAPQFREPPASNEPANFQPVKKERNEKVGFVNFVDESPVEEPQNRPQSSIRPGSSSAQMRAKMLEAKKNQLLSKPGANIVVQSGGLLGNNKLESAPLDGLLYSNTVLTEKDISGTRALKGFTAGPTMFEPNAARSQFDILPGPIKAEVTVIKGDDMDEVKLDERTALKNTPSRTLQEMHKKIEEAHKPVYIPPPQPSVPLHPQHPIVNQEKAKDNYKHQTEEIQVQEEHPKPQTLPPQRVELVLKPKLEEERLKSDTQTPGGDLPKRPEELKEPPKNIPKPPAVNVREIIANEMRDMKKFLTSPIVKGITLQCSIRRDKSGFNRLFPKYYMQTSEGLNFLLAGKKRAGNRTSNYMVTMNQKDFNTKSQSFIGKVRSNFLGTEFLIYDSGLNPKRKGANPTNIRSELGVVFYESNIMGSKGPRKMRVLAPAFNTNNESSIWKPMNKAESMLANYKEGRMNNMYCFFNKPPKWNERKDYVDVQAFVLNFNGRVDKASVKNFQLIDDKDENKIYLQFGRVGDQMFNLDFQWPFSPLLAFAIALTSFDNKFACE
ncbi:hypothetical protein SteCoe_22751 [Stentor coeruleus]|uniref:Tubby C-terminal domain-containing protein n=1 Tax=Stentor coeruleus TaxID=5963 RepID=A0A1R2BM47_9CILI|nr:hypothetical protein SteCoe_22751 [Stentor coeruleus]